MATRIIFILLLFFATFAQGQVLTSDTKDIQVARQQLRVGLDTSKYLSSTTHSIAPSSTHKQLPTAKAVYDYGQTLSFSLTTGPTLSGAGTIGSPLTIAQQSATSGQVLKWNGTTWLPAADAGTTYTAGTGISVVGTVISNTAPDQVVSIAGASGTYPNFTLPSTPTGSGTTNYLAKWTGTSALGAGQIFDNGTLVGINTNSGAGKLRVLGSGNTSGTYTAQFHNSGGSNNALLVRDDGKVSMGTTSADAQLSVEFLGGNTTAKVLEFTNAGGWSNRWIKSFNNTTTTRRGLSFGGQNISGGEVNDVLSILAYPNGRVAVNKPTTSAFDYSFEVASATDIDGIVVSRQDYPTATAMFHVNSEGDGILRSKSGYWTLGDIDVNIPAQNPSAILHLFTPSGSTTEPLFRGSKTGGFGEFVIEQEYSTPLGGAKFSHFTDGTNKIITLKSNNSVSTTWVGIGEANPLRKLHVQGDARITGSAGSGGNIMLRDGNGDITNAATFVGLAVSGTTITNTGDINAADDITTSTNSGGDLSGVFTNLQLNANVVGATELAATTVTAGTYTNATVVVDADGRITSAGSGATPGTVNSVSVASANGFAGTVATATTTPAITLSTTVSGLLKGNGTAISTAVLGTDYVNSNLYTADGTIPANRTINVGNNSLYVDATATTFSQSTPFIIKGKADGTNNTRGILMQDAIGSPKAHFTYTNNSLTISTYNPSKVVVGADGASWDFNSLGFVRPTSNSIDPSPGTGNGGAIWYNSTSQRLRYNQNNTGTTIRQIANVEDDITGSVNSFTTSTTLTGTNYTAEFSAAFNNITVTVDANMREGFRYMVRATGNVTNTVTISAGASHNLVVDGTTGNPTTYVCGQHELINLYRYGTTIYITK